MKILAIDFSSAQRSVAIVEGVRKLVEVVAVDTPRSSGGLGRTVPTLDIVESALRQSRCEREQIDCLAVGLGPGSYTGIRAAIALAQGWRLGREVKLLGLSSIECVAAQTRAEGVVGKVTVVVDAQRNEFYIAQFEISANDCLVIEPLRLASLADVQARAQSGDLIVGPEASRWHAGARDVFPRASALGVVAAERSDHAQGEKLEPIYLRETSFVKGPPLRVYKS
jgi:tRNA threonylcarbamoyl adenosine modification protein YeaZ